MPAPPITYAEAQARDRLIAQRAADARARYSKYTPTGDQAQDTVTNLARSPQERLEELIARVEALGPNYDPAQQFESLGGMEYYKGAVDEFYTAAGGTGDKYSTIKKYLTQLGAEKPSTAKGPPPPDATDAYIRMLAQGRIGQSLRTGGGF